MKMATDFPKVRYGLEAMPVEHEGRRMILLRDRLGYSRDSLLVSPQLVSILGQMNGQNSLRDLQVFHMRATGELLHSEQLAQILAKLDEHLFLENERFIAVAMESVVRFQNDPVKRMQFAGKSYPDDADSLRDMLEGYFAASVTESGRLEAQSHDGGARRIRALVAPHIDIQAGGVCFAKAYQALKMADSPQTWVILGTGHEPVENYFAITCKDFQTPLGLVEHDRDCCEALRELCPRDILASEYNHQREHTVEFQAVFLAYTRPETRIVPMLCSFSPDEWENDGQYIDEVVQVLRNLAQVVGRSVGIIASVDLAHIGPRYGDSFKPHRGTIEEHLTADRDLLDKIAHCDASGFMRQIKRENHARRICGLAPLYVLAKALEGTARGELLHHAHAVVDNRNSFVTFASMAFYE
jgi:hypothetical protein